MDPRISLIPERLSNVRRIIPVVSGKGGVGKSLISTMLAVALSDLGYKTALLDLDIYGSTCHTIMGGEKLEFVEDKGVIPPMIHGVKFMSPIIFSQNNIPLPLRGNEITDLILEIFAITIWGETDILVIDMPPGLGEELLDLMKHVKKAEYLVITTPSKLSLRVVERIVDLLETSNKKILGILGNMCKSYDDILKFSQEKNLRYLGCLPFDKDIEGAIGNIEAIKKTTLYKEVREIAKKVG